MSKETQGGGIENAEHFFFSCPFYNIQRVTLVNSVSVHSNISLQTILYGNLMLSFHANIAIFEAVQKYIHDTNRF